MKISNTLKKVVVLAVFCSQAITLYPMQQENPRSTRGLSLMSIDNLPFPGSLDQEETSLPRDPQAEKETRQIRLNTLFYGEGDTVINIPGQAAQDEPANLDEVVKASISQDADKDPKALAEQLQRQAKLARRLSLDQAYEQSTLPTRLSAVELETAGQPAPTPADLDAKINKGNQLVETIKQLMEKTKGHLAKGLERGAYIIAAANVALIIWSSVDAARHIETLPYVVYIADAALVVLTATAELLQSVHNKLKREVEDEFIPEDHPGSTPQPAMSFRQRLTSNLSNYWSKVTNCLSKVAATHLITVAAVASAGVTFAAAKWPEAISPTAAEWMDNGENILDGLIIGWLITSKVAVNKLYALREAKRTRERHGSADGKVHEKLELHVMADKRDSLKPDIKAELKPVIMVANPLVNEMVIDTERGGEVATDESGTPTPDPKERKSSEKPSPALPARQVEVSVLPV